MNFALLGDDPAVLPLVRAIAAHSGHNLVQAALAEQTLPVVKELVPAVEPQSGWEPLLIDGEVDAVIVAGVQPAVLEGARQLASAGKALLVFPQAEQGSEFAYELSLIRDNAHNLLVPIFPRRMHPLCVQAQQIVAAGQLGRVLHLQMEREEHSGGSQAGALLLRRDVAHALLPDLDLLRSLGGDYNRITAIYSGQSNSGLALATITLSGDRLPEAHWTLRPAPSSKHWRLVVTGEKGRLELDGGNELSNVRLDVGGEEMACDRGAAVFDAGDAMLRHFEAAAAGEPVTPSWEELTRCFETAEAARRSVDRRRTIDLYFEPASERSQFKTQMTAIGCGLLMLTLAAVVGLLMLGAVFNINPQAMKIARIAVFLPLFVFLVLQVLIVLARPAAARAPEQDESASAPGSSATKKD